MELTVGAVLEGKVKSITNFGAFIALPENKTGMVHISEVANAYVSDIRQYLTEGQDVKVMVIGNENGKINLSIKRLEPKPVREGGRPDFRNGSGGAPRREGGFRPNGGQNAGRPAGAPANGSAPRQNGGRDLHNGPVPSAAPKTSDQVFEERLKAFMSESDSKMASIKQYSEHRTKSRRR